MINYKNKKGQVVQVRECTLNGYTTSRTSVDHAEYRKASTWIQKLNNHGIRIGKLWHPGTER